LLAAVALVPATAGCGGDGAEPGAPSSATLVLDFSPNAVHAGIYAALRRGYYREAGVDLEVRQPSSSSDAPRLLEAGRADFAILDIHDLGIARERGLDVVGVMPIVQGPLASVIFRADRDIDSPKDLEGRIVGVTGLPSDDAVLDSVLSADGGDPREVHRVTIGFNAVASLASGRVDAATGFWNAEAVALLLEGTPVRVFKIDDFGAPRYPELVLCTSQRLLRNHRGLVSATVQATTRGYQQTVAHPSRVLADLLAAVPALEHAEQDAQLRVLLPEFRPPGRFDLAALHAWARWDLEHGILSKPLDVESAFEQPGGERR
jgi:putative hydroxymethylpyrimidine transport system substrate-binding protein